MTVGKRIKERRKELGLSQTELAQRVNVKYKSSISKIENGIGENMTTERLQVYATALNTTPIYLLGLCDDPEREFSTQYSVIQQAEAQAHRDAELLDVVRQLNDVNAQMLLSFAKTLLNSQES